MAPSVNKTEILELLRAQLSAFPESSARRLAIEIAVDKATINSVLYAHRDIFVSTGETPPLWSIRTSEPLEVSSITGKGNGETSVESDMQGPLGASTDKSIDTSSTYEHFYTAPQLSNESLLNSNLLALENKNVEPAENLQSINFPTFDEDDYGSSAPNEKSEVITRKVKKHENEVSEASEDLTEEVRYLVKKYPGIRYDELEWLTELDYEFLSKALGPLKYLVLTPISRTNGYSDAQLELLDQVAKAGTFSFPLSSDDYDELLRKRFITGVTSIRLTQIFGSWRMACELAGVESPAPRRETYERRWTNRELAETVARFLMEFDLHGAHHQYGGWRNACADVEEIPSSGTLRNTIGPSWLLVRAHGLEVLREKWYLKGEAYD